MSSTSSAGRGGKLTPAHWEALREVASYDDGRNWLYWWRRASMKALEEHGYVEMWRPKSLEHSRRKQLPYRTTEAGRQFFAALE